jgi:aconitase A
LYQLSNNRCRAASIVEQAVEYGITQKLTRINLSEQTVTLSKDGIIATFEKNGDKVFTNACGPCIDNGTEKEPKQEKTLSFTLSTVTSPREPTVTQHTRFRNFS